MQRGQAKVREEQPDPETVERITDHRHDHEAHLGRMGALRAVSFEAPLAVHDVAGAHGHHISEEIAELRVPAEDQRDQRIDADAESRDEGAADDEADELAEQSAAVWGSVEIIGRCSACSVAACRYSRKVPKKRGNDWIAFSMLSIVTGNGWWSGPGSASASTSSSIAGMRSAPFRSRRHRRQYAHDAGARAALPARDWFDLRQYRLNPPVGANIHWSRLVDLPIAGLILALRPLVGGMQCGAVGGGHRAAAAASAPAVFPRA